MKKVFISALIVWGGIFALQGLPLVVAILHAVACYMVVFDGKEGDL